MLSRVPSRPSAASRFDLRRPARFVSGLAVGSFGLTLMVRSELGAAPWEVFTGGVAGTVDLPVSLVRYLVIGAIIVLVAALGARMTPALIATGLIGATCMAVYDVVVPSVDGSVVRVAVFAVGLVVMAVGVAFYLHADLGAGPHDALILTASERTGRSLPMSRTACESAALVGGALLGGVVGVGTVAFALGLGPLIAMATGRIERHLPLPSRT
ncbi:MAG: YczE/YyaS/YitT family protein [Acidimicrobiales bacterium]